MNKKILKQHIIIITILLIVIFGLHLIFGSSCLFYIITGINCPFCGITRAHLSLLALDINKALEYHFFFYLGIPYLLLLVHSETEFIKKRKIFLFLIIIMTII